MASKKQTPTWSDVKSKLADFDRTGMLGIVQDLYAASKDNQVFLHARFGLGDDVLKPYKSTIARWMWPDKYKQQFTSVAKAKKAISDYKKAVGQPEELAELMVFYCEQASGFSDDVAYQDEGYFDALVGMFEQAAKQVRSLALDQQDAFGARLSAACQHCCDLGYGVYDDVRDILSEHGFTT